MEAIMQWGIGLILMIQSHRTPALDDAFHTITKLGGTWHMFIVPFVIWCLSYRAGTRMLVTLLLSTFVNFALKDCFAQPRPYQLEPRIGPDTEIGYGLPSGHAQHTLIEWSLIAAWVGKRWFWCVAAALIVLIGFSRIYLGVHFPSDVIGGWMIALAILWLHFRCVDSVCTRLSALGMVWQIAIAAGVSALFVLIYALALEDRYIVAMAGLLFGAASGIALCHRFLRAPESGAWWQRGLRYVVGMAALLVWLDVGGELIPDERTLAYFVVMYVVNGVAGLWITAGAPVLFQVLWLTPAADQRNSRDTAITFGSA